MLENFRANVLKQQRQQRTPKTTSIYNTTQYSIYDSQENLNSFSLSIPLEMSQTEYVKQLQNPTKKY